MFCNGSHPFSSRNGFIGGNMKEAEATIVSEYKGVPLIIRQNDGTYSITIPELDYISCRHTDLTVILEWIMARIDNAIKKGAL